MIKYKIFLLKGYLFVSHTNWLIVFQAFTRINTHTQNNLFQNKFKGTIKKNKVYKKCCSFPGKSLLILPGLG